MVMDQMGGRQLLQHLTHGLASVSANASNRLPVLNSSLTNILPPTSAIQLYAAAAAAANNLRVPPWAPFMQLPPVVNAGVFGADPASLLARQRLLTTSSAPTGDSVQNTASSPIGAAQQHPHFNLTAKSLPSFCHNLNLKIQPPSNASVLVAATMSAAAVAGQQLQRQHQQHQQLQAPFNLNLQHAAEQHKHNNVPQGPTTAADGNETNDDDVGK